MIMKTPLLFTLYSSKDIISSISCTSQQYCKTKRRGSCGSVYIKARRSQMICLRQLSSKANSETWSFKFKFSVMLFLWIVLLYATQLQSVCHCLSHGSLSFVLCLKLCLQKSLKYLRKDKKEEYTDELMIQGVANCNCFFTQD